MKHLHAGLLATVTVAAALALVPASSQAAYENLLAPASACPGGDDLTALSGDESAVMMCMIDFARVASGLNALTRSPLLAASSAIKADDIVRCKQFSHTACGKSASAPFEQAGYVTAAMPRLVNENLAGSADALSTPRAIMRAWLDNDEHRQAQLDPRWRDQGVAMRTPGLLPGLTDQIVWVSHFGGGDVVAPGGGGAAGGEPPAGGGEAGGAGAAGGGAVAASSLRLSVRPATVRSGRRVRFRFVLRVRPAGASLAMKRRSIRFASKRARLDAHGRATIVVRVRRPGRYRAVVSIGKLHGRATVRVLRR